MDVMVSSGINASQGGRGRRVNSAWGRAAGVAWSPACYQGSAEEKPIARKDKSDVGRNFCVQ